MGPAKIIFSDALSEKFLKALGNEMPFRNEAVAVKLHMGEPKNPNHLKADDVKKIVSLLITKGCRPFLFDSTVAYPGKRSTKQGYLEVAALNGFTEEFIGCPIIIGDVEHETVRGKIDYEVPKEICGVSVLVLTHVKGHQDSGVGAAIKNLGMGGMTKKTKSDIHNSSKPIYVGGCTMCGMCVENCPSGVMKLDEKNRRPKVPAAGCYGCSNCTIVCRHGALKPIVATFDFLIAEAAKAALSKFKKTYFVSFLQNMSKHCDCSNSPEKPVMDDIGILAGDDILAIESATHDMIVEKAGKDIFKELNKKSFTEQLKAAEELKMGNKQYKIEKA
jgi:hypothetical protein